MLQKDEFDEWQHHPVTREMRKWMERQIESAKETLAQDAGLNPLADRHSVGGIDAFLEMLDWKPVFVDSEEIDES